MSVLLMDLIVSPDYDAESHYHYVIMTVFLLKQFS